MKISSLSNAVNHFPKTNIKQNKKTNNVSFKSIYVEDLCTLGRVSENKAKATFLPKDALLLNEIAARYPNQDCFITKGFQYYPSLKFREKPVEVQLFSTNLANQYNTVMDPNDPKNPTVNLLLEDDEPFAYFYGLPSNLSLNPSLPFTVQAGFELHKRILDEKYKLLDSVGNNDDVDFGMSIDELARERTKPVELAVKRYLLESAYKVLTDKPKGSQIYESNFPKVQTRLQDHRRYDLTTSYAQQQTDREAAALKSAKTPKTDICEEALKLYPNMKENIERISELKKYMIQKNILM